MDFTLLEFLAVHGYLWIEEVLLILMRKEISKMAQYMDIHRNVGDIKKEQIDEAHKKDLAVQGKYGVEITDYWHSDKEGAIFCLADAPSKEAFGAVHREAHGLEANEIFEVKQGGK
jgi:hypothetical protein